MQVEFCKAAKKMVRPYGLPSFFVLQVLINSTTCQIPIAIKNNAKIFLSATPLMCTAISALTILTIAPIIASK